MKDRLNTVLLWVTGLFSLVAIATGIAGDSLLRSRQTCPSMKVCIKDAAVNKFASEQDITRLVDSLYGGYVNTPSERIDLCRMEKLLMGVDYIKDAVCYVTRDGLLHVEISQMTPVAKFRDKTLLCYMSGEGRLIKARRDWNDRIICLTGSPRMDDGAWRKKMGGCCRVMLSQPGFSSRIGSVECGQNGECTVFLKDRTESFLFGKPEKVASKLGKILRYEKEIAPGRAAASKAEEYTSVDVSCRGQIICKHQ